MKYTLLNAILLIVVIVGCSTKSAPNSHYYLLNSPTLNAETLRQTSTNIATAAKSSKHHLPVITLTVLELPDYLKQPNLVLQLSDHQLHYANFHQWAEPLQTSITQALNQDINRYDSRFRYVTPPSHSKVSAALIIDINAFHATHQSQVILTGKYWLKNKNIPLKLDDKSFTFSINLSDNGYAHAVTQMRNAITLLAKQITSDIATI